MKYLFLLSSLLFCVNLTFSQYTFTFSNKQTCWFNEQTKEFDICDKTTIDNSIMVINTNETIFAHTTMTMRSSYYVYDTDHDTDFLIYEVKSDVGNYYTFMVDINKRLFKVMGVVDGLTFATIYKIKAFF